MPQIRYFAFTPSEAGSYTFAGSDYTNMPSLQIYDAAEKLIVENKEAGESFVRAMLLADQTYYLAAGFFGDEIGGYDISIVYSPNEPWAAETAYAAGKIITFGTDANGEPVRYIVLQAHTSASHWFPSSTPSLYKQLEVPRWTQPFGVTDAYNAGDKVEYNGVLWISDINANVWSPGVAGWSVYNGPL
jgi:hypothetical protein